MIKKIVIALSIALFATSSILAQYELEGYIKAAPLHKSTKDIMNAAQKLGLPAEQQILPYLFLGFLGYPNYPGLSKEENVSLFVYSTPDYTRYQYVVLLKMDKSSPLRETFPQIGWIIKDYKDWTLLSQSKEILNNIQNPDSLIRVTQRATDSDIEAGYLFKQSRKHLLAFENSLKEDAADDYPISHDNVILVIDTLMDILERCHGGSFGINFHEDSIDLHFAIKANPNTPEAKLFAQQPISAYEQGKYLKRGNFFSAVGNSDIKADLEYMNFILGEAAGKASPSSKESLHRIKTALNKSLSFFDGSIVGTLSVNDTNSNFTETYIHGGNHTEESAIQYMKSITQAVLGLAMPEGDLKLDFEISKNIFTVEGTPVHRINLKAKDSDSNESNNAVNPEDYFKSTYLAVVEGLFISSTDEESIKKYITSYKSRSPILGSVFDILPPKDKFQMQFELNAQAILEALLKEALKEGPNTELQTALDSINSSKFKPIRGLGSMEDKSMKLSINIPLNNIYKLQSAFKNLSPSVDTTYSGNGEDSNKEATAKL